MKKLLMVLTGLAFAGSAYAADDTQLKFNGEIRARYIDTWNVNGGKGATPDQNVDAWYQRSLLGVTAMKGETLTGHIQFLNANTWGRDLAAGDGVDLGRTSPDNTVILTESWVWWKASDMMSLRFGRGGMTIADGSVVSKNDWEQIPRVFEGVLGIFDFGFASLQVFGVRAIENGLGYGISNSLLSYDKISSFYGLSFDFKNLPDAIKMANIHLIQENQDLTTATPVAGLNNKNYLRYGVTVGGDVSGFDFKGTYAGISGKNRGLDSANDVKVNASMFDLAAGFTMPEMMNFHVGAQYHMDSGDNDDDAKTNGNYDPFHYDQHEYSGKMDIVGWGNVTYWGLAAAVTPMDKTTFGVEYMAFSRTSNKASATSNISIAPATLTGNDKNPIGTELDITAAHKYSDAFAIEARYGMFTQGDYLTTGAVNGRDNVSDFYLNATYKF